MIQVAAEWNPMQSALKSLLQDEDRFAEAIALCLRMHALLHCAGVSGSQAQTFMDAVWDGLSQDAFAAMPGAGGHSIAWNIWHITRIEDITANILIAEIKQVLTAEWLDRLNVTVRDTANAMDVHQISRFSRSICMEELRSYRNAVGQRTREMLRTLAPEDLHRVMRSGSMNRVQAEGGVIDHPESIWLLDFWRKKTVAGILLMPLTRHQVVHLNECLKIKLKVATAK